MDGERCLATLTSPEDEGNSTNTVSFGPDGNALVVGGHGGATIWDLAYFDRHVAGNLPYQLKRFEAELEGEIDGEALRAWARDVLARPWPKYAARGPSADSSSE